MVKIEIILVFFWHGRSFILSCGVKHKDSINEKLFIFLGLLSMFSLVSPTPMCAQGEISAYYTIRFGQNRLSDK